MCVKGTTSGVFFPSLCGTLLRRPGLTLTCIMWFMMWVGLQFMNSSLLTCWYLEPSRVLQDQKHECWLWGCSRNLVVPDAVSCIYCLSTVANPSGSRSSHQLTQTIGIFEVLTVPLSHEAIYTRLSEDGQRQFLRFFKSGNGVEESDKHETHVLWEARRPSTEVPQPTSLLPLDNDVVLRGYGMFRTPFTADWLNYPSWRRD